jgi:hypothetical protein
MSLAEAAEGESVVGTRSRLVVEEITALNGSDSINRRQRHTGYKGGTSLKDV